MNTDYRELEQRLREIPPDINIGWHSDPIDFHAPLVHVDLSALCSASADAINALREENERLREYAEMMDKDMIATIEQRDELVEARDAALAAKVRDEL